MFGAILNFLRGSRPSVARPARATVLRELPTQRIHENPENARRQTNLASFEELKQSVQTHGILVPLIVRPEGTEYTLIAGHRRLRAARELGLARVPALVRRVSETRAAELALIENSFRLDLSKLELLRAFESVVRRRPARPREALAEALGLDAAALADAAFLSTLPEDLQHTLEAGLISEDQATRLADVPDEEARLEMVDLVREGGLDADATRGLVDRTLGRDGRFVTSPESRHFHAPGCAFARIIPEPLRRWVYSKRDGLKLGKIACMNCL
jgi:ParB family chromosome partitioning protein